MTECFGRAQWMLFKDDLEDLLKDTDNYVQIRKGLRELIEGYEDWGYRGYED